MVERYFRSLQDAASNTEDMSTATTTTTTTTSAVTTTASTTPDDDDDDGQSYGAALKQSFRAHVDAVKLSLLQSLDSSTGMTSSEVRGHDVDPCDLELNVRDSENFVYDDSEERKRETINSIPEAVRNELKVDLGDSVGSVVLKHTHLQIAENNSSQTSTRKSQSGTLPLTDSTTFDYVNLCVSQNWKGLPEDLRQELRLDLRDWAEDRDQDDDQVAQTGQTNVQNMASTDLNSEQQVESLLVLKKISDDDRSGDLGKNTITGNEEDMLGVNNYGKNDAESGKKSPIPNTTHQCQDTIDPGHLWSSGRDRKSTVSGGVDNRFDGAPKPVQSKTRPQTAATVASSVVKKKSVAWSHDTRSLDNSSSPSSKTVQHATSARTLGGRHVGDASANQPPTSSSAEQRNSKQRCVYCLYNVNLNLDIILLNAASLNELVCHS